MVDSTDLAQVVAEAEDIAQSVGHAVTSAHLLLALFTVPNQAARLLQERNVSEDTLLAVMTKAPKELESTCRNLFDKAREIAETVGSAETDCVHLLLGMTRVSCTANDLLKQCLPDLSNFRNHVMSYYTAGRVPRRASTTLPVAAGSRPSPSVINPYAPKAPAPRALPAPPRSELQARPVTRSEPLARATPAPLPAVSPLEEEDELFLEDIGDELVSEEFIEVAAPLPVAKAAPAAKPAHAAAAAPAAHPAKPSHELDPKQFPWLAGLGRNLTVLALRHQLDPVVGRDREIDEVIDILGKRRTNNPCLLGEPGVGKTAVVEGVAQALLKGKGTLAEKVVVELDMASVVAGTQLRGSFSEKLNGIKDEVKKANGRIVVFIDELHTVVGAGSTGEGPQDAANELKSALARGEFPCIGATTHDEWRKFISTDPALERRFTPVMVNEPTVAQTTEILKGVVDRYARHHGLTYAPDSLGTAAQLAARYVSDRFLPDKAISIVDLAGSRCAREGKGKVEAQDVARIVAKLAGIPEERLLMKDTERLLRLEDELSGKVIGHRGVIERVAKVVRRNYAGFGSKRPMGSFLFLGPTGVGKTELAKALAETLYGSADALVRVDMSELSEAHTVAKLVGAPPGYVGYGEGGQLTEPVRRRPASVVLLDEVEKAHRDVLLLLLQVLDEGRLTDGRGRHIDFSNTVVILTSNLGAQAFGKAAAAVGFGSSATGSTTQGQKALELARAAMPPELWNRIDERLVFTPLDQAEIARIAHLMLNESSERLQAEKGIRYAADEAVVSHLIAHGGFDLALGARPMRQTVQRLIEGPLAERILSGDFDRGDAVQVVIDNEAIQFKPGSLPV
jgi:ATP-dependent Clp protease ATP-binding subunit ClpC